MSLHLVSSDARKILRDETGAIDRAATIKQMADHLVGAIMYEGLDTSSDSDVIAYLYDAPDRYHHRVVLDHYEDAVAAAKQTLVMQEMSR